MNRNAAITKLEGLIQTGKAQTVHALEEIQKEWSERRDIIVRPDIIDYDIDEFGVHPLVDDRRFNLTGHSYQQLVDRAEIPRRFSDKLMELGQRELLKTNLKTLMPKVSRTGVLIRHIDVLAKGILSSSYRRMDAGPIFEGFFQQGLTSGMVPYGGDNTDKTHTTSMIYPDIYEPTPNEFVVPGMRIKTSDYGAGALQLEMMVLRIMCANLHVGLDVFRKVHLGKRFDVNGYGNSVIELSQRTHNLDTRTMASAVRDAVTGGQKLLGELMETVKKASEEEVDIVSSIASLKKKGVKKELLERIEATYALPAPIEVLPEAKTKWRLANTISLIAGQEKGDTKLELENIAFDMMSKAA